MYATLKMARDALETAADKILNDYRTWVADDVTAKPRYGQIPAYDAVNAAVRECEDALCATPTVAAQQCGACLEAWGEPEVCTCLPEEHRAYLTSATPPDVAGLIERLEKAKWAITNGKKPDWDAAERAIEEAATALRLSAGGGWRDAGSAPEDGSVILAYRPDAGVFTAHYVEEDAHLSSLANPPEGDCYWFATNGEDLTGDMFTHWQPLPVPPTAPAEGA